MKARPAHSQQKNSVVLTLMLFQQVEWCNVTFCVLQSNMPKIKWHLPTYKSTRFHNGRLSTKRKKLDLRPSKSTASSLSVSSEVAELGPENYFSASIWRAQCNSWPQQSRYYAAKSKEVTAWQGLRSSLYERMVETHSPKSDMPCTECGTRDIVNLTRCLDCGPCYHGCLACVLESHRHRPFHRLEEWMVSFCHSELHAP